MFNQYLWCNYLKAGGQQTVKTFEQYLQGQPFLEKGEMITELICRLHSLFSPCKYNQEELKEDLRCFKELFGGFFCLTEDTYTYETAMETLISNLKMATESEDDAKAFQYFSSAIVCHTSALSMSFPEFFVPWFFKYSFNIFKRICDYFEIELPTDTPAKADYRGRIIYYGEISAYLQEFREANGLTPAELCAFLYEHAPRLLLESTPLLEKVVDKPRSAYFIGALPSDEYVDNGNDTIRFWQANPDIQVGDALVMYLKAPVSRIDSIWRAQTPGFIDPFFWYYRCAYIGSPVKAKGFTVNQLKTDITTKDMPIVKKNLQGINGTNIMPSVYNYMVHQLLSDRGEDYCIQYAWSLNPDKILSNEHDVEVLLLEPLLEKLGYRKEDWCRQMNIKIGRNERVIPDYVLFPVYTPGKERGKIILEAKFSISDLKQMEIDRRQAASYGKQLVSQYAVLVAKEGVWVYTCSNNFEKMIFHCNWAEVENNDDIFSKLYHLIGK